MTKSVCILPNAAPHRGKVSHTGGREAEGGKHDIFRRKEAPGMAFQNSLIGDDETALRCQVNAWRSDPQPGVS